MREIKVRYEVTGLNGIPITKTYDINNPRDVSRLEDHYNKKRKVEFRGQYTGLKDRHGKQIFEGDVVKHVRTVTSTISFGETIEVTITRIGRVVITPSRGTVIIGKIKVVDYNEDEIIEDWHYWRGTLTRYGDFSEIIGNIHQHPELLNKDA